MKSLALPLRVRDGVFETVEAPESLLAFAVCFFHEWCGSIPDDPGFGAAGTPWGRREAPLAPLEPVLNEFRRRFGARYEVRASVGPSTGGDGRTRQSRFITVKLRSDPDRGVVIEL